MDHPSTIGRYEVAELIGRGGMGVVYRGRDPILDRNVAIKVMAPDLSDDIDARAHFFREAKAAAQLQHRNIITIFEFGEADGNLFIAMEFLRGQNLAARLRTTAPLEIDAAADIVIQLCTGLHHAHASGLVHRDVKPANVWILPDGAVKLLDFGIARVSTRTLTQRRDTQGTVAYMAPERFSDGPVDSRADIFGVGVILYELLAGRRPFEGDTPTVIVSKILEQEPPPLLGLAPHAPPALLDIVDRALQKDPNSRYQTALEMATDVRLAGVEHHAAVGIPADFETVIARPVPRERRPRRPRPGRDQTDSQSVPLLPKRQLHVGGAVLAAIALLAVVGVIWLGAVRRSDIRTGITIDPGSAPRTARDEKHSRTGLPELSPVRKPPDVATVTGPVPPVISVGKTNSAPAARSAGSTRADLRVPGLVWAYVPAGTFEMGCTTGDTECEPAERPTHAVQLTAAFWMMTTEVTIEMFRGSSIRLPPQPNWNSTGNHPVVGVTWAEAMSYCRSIEGRLPSEAEWEFGARGGLPSWRYPWGERQPVCRTGAENGARFNDGGECDADGRSTGRTDPVGSYGANGYNLRDMAGNVWEWVADRSADGYASASARSDPDRSATGEHRVVRGGAWLSPPRDLRVSYRTGFDPAGRYDGVGFRCASDAGGRNAAPGIGSTERR